MVQPPAGKGAEKGSHTAAAGKDQPALIGSPAFHGFGKFQKLMVLENVDLCALVMQSGGESLRQFCRSGKTYMDSLQRMGAGEVQGSHFSHNDDGRGGDPGCLFRNVQKRSPDLGGMGGIAPRDDGSRRGRRLSGFHQPPGNAGKLL